MLKVLSAAAVAVALAAAPIAGPAFAEPAKKEQTEAQKAAAERRKQCSKEWADAKAAGKVKNGVMTETKQKWPQFNGACMKRLSGNT
jgi:Ni/Co efflux regulator RcnB